MSSLQAAIPVSEMIRAYPKQPFYEEDPINS
jgi:hypothetical protein